MHRTTVKKKVEVVECIDKPAETCTRLRGISRSTGREWHRQTGRNVHATARHFGIDRKRVREWDKNFETLLQRSYGKGKAQRKLSSGAPVFSEELDDALFEFFESERSAGRAVSNRLLAEEARKIADNLKLGNFAASSQYIKRWKARFGVTMRQATNDSQKTLMISPKLQVLFDQLSTLCDFATTSHRPTLPTWIKPWSVSTILPAERTTLPVKQQCA
ncbi:hypothetical protein HPB48_013032 [Haemaphysalis longicornis]|uniref:HTH CENPB-type domain-containing protein n=1 Tax=Haemaphysalis longicornis TaxID=44386 RepID=A0A9J6GS10_HAELO|nr:hypothetical protein HPB48_013032 [Haemaphysalis longicornis]